MFGRFDLLAKRCRKLATMFTTIEQFSKLTQVCARQQTHRMCIAAHLATMTSASCLHMRAWQQDPTSPC